MISLNTIKNRISEIKKSDFTSKVIGGTFFLTAGTVISKVLIAVAYIILARILTPEEYGEYGMIKSTIDNFLILATMGIGLTTTKYISENKSNNPQLASGILGTALGTVLILGLIVGGFFFVFSDYIAINLLKSETLQPLLKYAALILVLTAFNSIQLGALLGLQGFRSTSISNIAQGLLLSLGLIIGGYINGVKGAVLGNLIGIIVLSFVIQYLLKKENSKFNIRVKFNSWRRDLRIIYKFALPASLSSLITSPAIWILNMLLVRTENGYEQLGIYSAVIIFSTAIQMLNGSLNNVLLPIFLSGETEVTPKREFFNYFSAWILAIIIGLPLIVFPELVTYIIGDKYPKETVVTVLGLTLISTLIIANRQGVSRDLIMKNKMWLSVFSMGQWALTAIVLFYFMKNKNAIGFAASMSISYFINLLLFIPFFVKMKISPSYIFYSKWVILIWICLITLIFVNQNMIIAYRFLLSIGFLILLILSFKKLYVQNASKVV